MTYAEIIKALRDLIHLGDAPIGKSFGVMVDKQTLKEAFDLINRLKAENEKSQKRISSLKHALFEQQSYTAELQNELVTAKSEAYKEFAERLKEEQQTFVGDEYAYKFIYLNDIDNLLKEMR